MVTAWVGMLIAGMMGGSFAVPAKKIRQFHWDQTWLIYCFVAMVALPVALGLICAPWLFRVGFPAHPGSVLLVATFGLSFGLGAVLFGRAIPRLGFALAYAIVCGTVAVLGSLGPLIVGAAQIGKGQEGRLALGLGLLVAAIAFSARASILRDRQMGTLEAPAPTLTASLLGVGLAVFSGVLSSLLNTGFAYGQPLVAEASAAGVQPLAASMAVWIPVLLGGFLVNLGTTAWKIGRAGDWHNFKGAPMMDWLRASSLGLIWFGAILVYSLSSAALGSAGTVNGYAVNAGAAILTSAAWGFATGEWKNAGRAARSWALGGALLFGVAFAVLATKS